MDAAKLARPLGYFSLGLGLTELLTGGALARALGLGDRGGLVRAYGMREIGAGIAVLSAPTHPGPMLARVAGDALDVATLVPGLRRADTRPNALVALGAVLGVTLLDVICARALSRLN